MKIYWILGLILLAAGSANAGEDLKLSNGKVLKDAVVVRMSPATYIVQTNDALLELSEDEIDSDSLRQRDFKDERAPVVTNHYFEIHADGTATSYWTMPITNNSRYALDEIRMGLAPWERAMVDQRVFVDDRGQVLKSEYDPPRKKWAKDPKKRIQHNLQLNQPLAPGEKMTFTGRETSSRIHKTDDGLLFKFHGDYSEDRHLTLKVKIPQGAKIQRISPAPSVKFEHEGCEYLVWRRYYQKAEVYPIEVIYNLD